MANRSLMCIGAHADDIEFEAGGTCLKYHDAGYKIDYVMSTNNMSGQFHIVEKDQSVTRTEIAAAKMEPLRKQECVKAAAVLGTAPVHLDHPQRHYTSDDLKKINEGYGVPPPRGVTLGRPVIMVAHEERESVERVTDLILGRDPEAVLSHALVTDSPEHYATSLLVQKAWRNAVKAGYEGILLLWNEFVQSTTLDKSFCRWDSFIDISGLRQRQFDLIRCHITMVPFPERMDYLDFTPWLGIKDAELFKLAGARETLKPSGDFTEEIIRNYKSRGLA
jgi:LmbE family N-acetylglucosaminyl deacetylase